MVSEKGKRRAAAVILLGGTVSLIALGASRARAQEQPPSPPPPPSPPTLPQLILEIDAVPLSGDAPLTVVFQALADGVPPFDFLWSFGDGADTFAQNPSHTYGEAGRYRAVCSVTDAEGRQASASVDIVVTAAPSPPPPPEEPPEPLSVEVFGPTPANPVIGDAVGFESVVSGGRRPYIYFWEFGEGQSSIVPNPVWYPKAAGNFVVTLSIGDAGGQVAQIQKAVTVMKPLSSPSPPPVSPDTLIRDISDPALWNGQTLTVSGCGFTKTVTIVSMEAIAYTAGSTGQASLPVGEWIACHPVYDGVHWTVKTEQNFSVSISASPTTSGAAPSTINFEAIISSMAVRPLSSILWDFGDGSTSRFLNPSHTFTSTGNYTVTLSLIDAVGASGSARLVINVFTPAPLPTPSTEYKVGDTVVLDADPYGLWPATVITITQIYIDQNGVRRVIGIESGTGKVINDTYESIIGLA